MSQGDIILLRSDDTEVDSPDSSVDHTEVRCGKTGADLRGLQEEFLTGRGYPPPPDPRPDGRLCER